jgi:asparagine synthase (glutamine-hydrolysing)
MAVSNDSTDGLGSGDVYSQAMCGICGVVDFAQGGRQDPDLLARMVAALAHRGPDERGCYREGPIQLGHARLSIIDLAGGTQPICNETQTIWVVFNGEIYNYLELTDQLRAAGHRFDTRSDTEVIVHAYEQWGPECVARFNGQFAFALWDRTQRRLMLARDPVGIRPLYYARAGSRLLFASEMKALLQDPTVPRAIDLEGLSQVFSLWSPIAPRTALRGIEQLVPGSFMLLDERQQQQRRFWTPEFLPAAPDRPYASESELDRLASQLRDQLERATRLRMLRADVPVGVYLSGGIDSSVIGALVRRFHSGPLRTFSLRFAHQDFDEGRYQREMVARLGTEHEEVTVDYHDVGNAFFDAVWFAESPVLRAAPAPLLMLSHLVRESGYKVVLTGEGADEFLGGYDIFREAKVRRFWAKSPQSTLRPLLLERLYPWLARAPAKAKALQRAFFGRGLERAAEPVFSHLPRWQSALSLQRLFSTEVKQQLDGFDPIADLTRQLPSDLIKWEPLGQSQFIEITTLLSGYLLSSQGDRMLMGNSVEGRFPVPRSAGCRLRQRPAT